MTTDLQIVEHTHQRILTTAQIAAAYGTDPRIISNNFTRNKDRYTPGKHYFCLVGEDKRQFVNRHQIDDGSKNANVLYLWTEKGAFMHAKSLNTDQAWNAYEMLVDEYYRLIHPPQAQSAPPQPACTLADVLRQRAFLNEGRVPAALFSTQCELTRELHYVEGFLNTTLDTGAYIENSVGQCFSPYARNVLHLPDSERRKYRHQLPNGRIVAAWAYPIGYLPDFRRWLYEVYFPVKYPVYRRYRARRSGAAQALQGGVTKKLIAQRCVEQLPLF